MNKLLLIIDPQIDFITGTLPVPNAEQAMTELADYIRGNNGCYSHKIITADRHPFNHCSFKPFGGDWPQHCIHDTAGASIWQPLMEPLYLTQGEVTFLYKGQEPLVEEYSIFKNVEAGKVIQDIVKREGIDRIDICGLAGDICVLNTLRDGMEMLGKDLFNVLQRFAPSLDGGKALDAMVTQSGLSCSR